MISFDDYTNENKAEHNLKWPYIPDHPYRILTIGVSGSGKTNVLLNLLSSQSDNDKLYLRAKDPYEAKYQHVFDDMIADMINNNNSIATELFIRGTKLNVSIAFITQSYFKGPKDVRLNSKKFFIMKIPNKRELQQIF